MRKSDVRKLRIRHGLPREYRLRFSTAQELISGAVVIGTVLASCVLATPAEAASTSQSPTTKDKSKTAVASRLARQEAQALAQARSTHKSVAIDALTTENSVTTVDPSGSFTIDQSFAPVRVKQGGVWRNLDATLRFNRDGSVSPNVATDMLTLSGGGNGLLAVMIAPAGRSMSLSWPTALPKPALSGPTATYSTVLPGVDLVVTATTMGGFSETLVVKTAQAAANPALSSLKLAIQTTGDLTTSTDAAGNTTARATANGEPIFTAAPPIMWDSASAPSSSPAAPKASPTPKSAPSPAQTSNSAATTGQTSTAQRIPRASTATQPGSAAHIAKIKTSYAAGSSGTNQRAGTLNLVPDRGLLTRTSTVFPVYIDPTFVPPGGGGGTKMAWAQTDTINKDASHWKPNELQNGDCDPQWTYCSGFVAEAYVQMSVPSAIRDSQVKISESKLYLTVADAPYGSNCSTAPTPGFELWWTGAISSSTTWNSAPSWTQKINTQYPPACTGAKVGFDATAFMQSHAQGNTNITFGIAATSESDPNSWKEFYNSSLSMETKYDHIPNLPSRPSTSPGGACQTNPANTVIGNNDITLQSIPTDPDGGTLGVEFVLKDKNGKVLYDNGDPTPASSNLNVSSGNAAQILFSRTQFASWNAGMGSAPYTYTWYTKTSDGLYPSPSVGLGSIGSPCAFTYDTSTPAAPSVTVNTTNPMLGQPISVTINPASGTSPSRYGYQFDDGPIGYTPAGGTQNITLMPRRLGPNTLTVSAYSAGGNPGQAYNAPLINVGSVAASDPNYLPTTTVVAPGTPYTDGDITGSGQSSLLTAGGTGATGAGLWLSVGDGAGHLNGPTNIGGTGTGVGATRSAADWNGAQVLHGDFTGNGVQDVIAYYPTGTHAGVATLLYGNGDAMPLNPTSGTQQVLADNPSMGDSTINSSANGNAGDWPTQLVAAGNASQQGNYAPDLIGIAGDGTNANNYELNLYTGAAFTAYSRYQALADRNSSPDGGSDWGNFTLTTARPGGDPTKTVLFALKTSTGDLWESVNPNAGTANAASTLVGTGYGTTASTWTKISTPWTSWSTGMHLVQGDLTSNGVIELWVTTDSSTSSTPYVLNGATLTPESGAGASSLLAPTHQWLLNDPASSTSAADTGTAASSSTAAIASSSGVTFGSPPDANNSTGTSYDGIRGSVATFDGKSGYLHLEPDNLITGSGSGAYDTISVSFLANAGTNGILVSSGHDTPDKNNSGAMPLMYIGTDGRLYAQFWNGYVRPIVSPQQVDDGQWHTATLASNGADQSLYLDNNVRVGMAGSPTVQNLDPQLYAGAGIFNTNAWVNAPGGNTTVHNSYFTGQIANLVIYTGVQLAFNITILAPYNQPAPETGTLNSALSSSVCMDDWASASTNAPGNSDKIVTWTCEQSARQFQTWHFNPDHTITLASAPGMCLADPNGSKTPGVGLILYKCDGGAEQVWNLESLGQIWNPQSNLCLADPNSNTSNGTQLILWNCDNGTEQNWQPTLQNTFSGPIISVANTGLCMDNVGGTATSPGSVANGNGIQILGCDGWPSQNWTIQPSGNVVLTAAPGKCLDIPGTAAPGTKLDLWDCNGQTNQQWQSTSSGYLQNPASGLCADIGAGTAGTRIQLASCSGTSQEWTIP